MTSRNCDDLHSPDYFGGGGAGIDKGRARRIKGRTRKTKAGPDVSGDKGRTRNDLNRLARFLEHSMKYFVGNVDVDSFFDHRHIL